MAYSKVVNLSIFNSLGNLTILGSTASVRPLCIAEIAFTIDNAGLSLKSSMSGLKASP